MPAPLATFSTSRSGGRTMSCDHAPGGRANHRRGRPIAIIIDCHVHLDNDHEQAAVSLEQSLGPLQEALIGEVHPDDQCLAGQSAK